MASNNPRRPGLARQVCTVRIDPLVWRTAKAIAHDLGVPMGSIVERQLTEFVRATKTPDGAARYLTRLPKPTEGLFS